MKTKTKALAWSLLGLVSLLAQPHSWANEHDDVLNRPAVQGAQAQHAVLLGITRAGERLVAVGERGIVLYSDDNGERWQQAAVPVSSTLTAVQFVDAQQGWAVGHAGVVLHSRDGGASWQLQLDGLRAAQLELDAAKAAGDSVRQGNAERLVEDGADKPLLALYFRDARHGLVVGAYGLALHTDDGGATWSSWMDRLPNPRGLHLYAVAGQGEQLYFAGEQGVLLGSQDGGRSVQALTSPYAGSWFSMALLPDGALLVGGLRGKLFRSRDHGASFQALGNPVPISINAALVTQHQLLLVNQAGGLLQSELTADALRPVPSGARMPLSAVAQAADGSLVAVGVAGPLRLATGAAAPSSTTAE